MKTIQYLFIGILALTSLSACETENGEVFVGWFVDLEDNDNSQQFRNIVFNINNSTLINGLNDPYDNLPVFENGQVGVGYQVRTNLFIYNNNGELVDDFTSYNSSFNQQPYYNKELSDGSYEIVVITDISYNNADNVWKITDTNNLNTLKIVFANNYIPGHTGIVASRRQLITVNSEQSFTLTPNHLGAFYVIYFKNFNFTSHRYLYFSINIDPDQFNYSANNYTRTQNMYRFGELDFENQYSGYYIYAYLFPKSGLVLQYVPMDNNKNYMTTMKSTTLTSSVANHRMVTVDVATSTATTATLAPQSPMGAPESAAQKVIKKLQPEIQGIRIVESAQ